MNIILLDKVANLGDLGDQVTVKSGYARNFLFPQGKAVPATKGNLEMFEQRRAEYEARLAEELKQAEERAEQINAMDEVVVESKAGDEGKLFGSIGTRDIADAVTAKGVEVQKSEILMPHGTIREVGEYELELQLHADVMAAIKLVVKASD